MDDLKGKFKTLFSKASNAANKLSNQGFQGQGHRLGTAEEHGVKPKVQGQAVLAAHAANGPSSSVARGQQQQQLQQPTAGRAVRSPTPPKEFHELKPATEFNPFTAVIGSGAALSAAMAPPAPAPDQHQCHQRSQPPADQPCDPLDRQQQQRVPEAAKPVPVMPDQIETMRHCLGLIASQQEAAAGSMQVLYKLLGNLAAAPQEAKFRHIRLSNPRIQQGVVEVAGGLDFLAACGFEVHAACDSSHTGGDADEGFAVFLDDSQLSLVHAGLQELQRVLAAVTAAAPLQQQQQQQQQQSKQQQQQQQQRTPCQSAAAAASSTSSPQPVPAGGSPTVTRDTQVLLPAAPDTNVPDWFFERTPADVKAEYAAMVRRRAAGEVVASKAWKDAQLGKGIAGKHQLKESSVRVRFPEGVCLQGRFHVNESLTALFEWVTDSLRNAAITYELVGPDRKVLIPAGTISSAGLVPAALVSFRPLGEYAVAGYQLVDASGRAVSYLKDPLLLQAKAD